MGLKLGFQLLLIALDSAFWTGSAVGVSVVTGNCSSTDTPCGPTCCTEGLGCSFRRGIPICAPPHTSFTSGFENLPCLDPYLNTCDIIDIPGFCCPIGTVCFTDGTTNGVQCIDALGRKAESYQASAITNLTLPAIPAMLNGPEVTFEPQNAWIASSASVSCAADSLAYTTNLVNSTVSFNYTGPSVEVHIIRSLKGGVFSVFIDGFNTTSVIDTYADDENEGPANNTACFPFRYPPFATVPTDYGARNDHTITLVFVGPSPDPGPQFNASEAIGQINGFAIPDLSAVATNAGWALKANLLLYYGPIFLLCTAILL